MIATQDAVILGRRSYDEWVGFWPGGEIEPFATFINEARRDLRSAGAAVDERARDRRRSGRVRAAPDDGPGGDIGVHGSISVAQALLAGGLVDELRLVIAPSIAGGGRRLPAGLPSMQLESIRSEISPTGYLLVDYRVIR